MADPIIKLKRSAVYGKIPTADQLPLGEVALNTYDGYLYASKNVGIGTTVIAINPFRVGTGTDSYNTFFTAGNVGLGLTNPTERLHVSGNVIVTGITTFQDNVDIAGNLAVDTNTLFVNSTTNRIGIGTDNPAYQVEIENTGANALLVLDRTDGAACFIEGQLTRSAFGSVNATPLALAYNSAAVVLVGASGSITVNPDGDGFTFPTIDGNANEILQTDGDGNLSFTSNVTFAELNVTGVSTFAGTISAVDANFSGNVTIGGTLTYEDVTNIDSIGIITARSDVKVGGNLSVVGITTLASAGGITTTGGDLYVNDDIFFRGNLYQNNQLFTAGIGIGSDRLNDGTGITTNRIGVGFTDINFVGTGLSITGYGSTVVVDFGNLSGGTGSRVSVSSEAPSSPQLGDLWWGSETGDLKVYYEDVDSAQWVDANSGSQSLAIISETSPAGYGVTASGTLWWDSGYGILKVYYDDGDSEQWVDANSGAYINYWTARSSDKITTDYSVGIGTTNPSEKLQVDGNISINNQVSYGTTTAVTASTSQVAIHSSLAIASYRSVEYTIQATEGSNFHTTKILALHDGSSAYHTEYGSIFNNAAVSTYDVDVSGGNMRLLATPASASTTNFKVVFNGIKD